MARADSCSNLCCSQYLRHSLPMRAERKNFSDSKHMVSLEQGNSLSTALLLASHCISSEHCRRHLVQKTRTTAAWAQLSDNGVGLSSWAHHSLTQLRLLSRLLDTSQWTSCCQQLPQTGSHQTDLICAPPAVDAPLMAFSLSSSSCSSSHHLLLGKPHPDTSPSPAPTPPSSS